MSPSVPGLRSVLLGAGLFVLVNLLLFTVYRSVFVARFVEDASFSTSVAIFLSGFRLDLALLVIELFLLLTISLLIRFLFLRPAAVLLATLTATHLFVAIANLVFFSERNQHLWEMLFANLAEPGQILNSIEPYIKETPVLTGLVIVGSLALVIAGFRKTRPLSRLRIDLWSSRRRVLGVAAACLVLLVAQLDRIDFTIQRGWKLGWIPMPTSSQYYMRFDSYLANQSVINPVHDFVRFYLPAQLSSPGVAHEERLDPEDALALTQELLGIEVTAPDAPFPLRKRSQPVPGTGLTNVVLIEVEGLSQSMVHMTEDSRPVMPFLHGLSSNRACLYVPNLIQNYNATDGGVLSTLTGTYKAFFNEDWKYFLPDEVNGYFASLPRILGKSAYRHPAFFGFRNRREDFSTFLRNQGYSTMDLEDFKALDRPGSLDALGVFDHVLFEVGAEKLRGETQPFSAYFMTATTHSPWSIPDGHPKPFTEARFNAFHYLDQSIATFIEGMRSDHPAFEQTLFVVTGDHTSVTFGPGLLERIRIPLFLYAERLAPLKDNWRIDSHNRFGQVDIVPTILDLLAGEHVYSGLGRSIVNAKPGGAGAISSKRYSSLYLKEDFAFLYSPFAPVGTREQLFAIRDGEIVEQDVATAHPGPFETLAREFFALYETSARLTRERRFHPAGQ